MKTWYEIFNSFMNPVFTESDFEMYKKIALSDLKFYGKYLKDGDKVLDIGSGPGCTSVPLGVLGFNVTGVDIDNECLEAAQKNAKLFKSNAQFIYADAFNLIKIFGKDCFDACISGGVLEHFDQEDIQRLVSIQLQLAPVVLADMPVKTNLTMDKYGMSRDTVSFTDQNGIYRNLWDEETWVNQILKGFNVVEHQVVTSQWGFDEVFVVIKR